MDRDFSFSAHYQPITKHGLLFVCLFFCIIFAVPKGRMAEWLKALVSKTGIPLTGYRGFESPFFRKLGKAAGRESDRLFSFPARRKLAFVRVGNGNSQDGQKGHQLPFPGLQGPPRRGAWDVADRKECKSPPARKKGQRSPRERSPPATPQAHFRQLRGINALYTGL